MQRQLRELRARQVNSTSLHTALRRLRRHGTDGRAQSVLIVVALTVGAIGPFGTYGQLSLPVRLGYWLVVVIGAYGMGFVFSEIIAGAIGERLPALARDAVAGAIAGLPIGLNRVAFGADDGVGAWSLLIYWPLIAMAVTVLLGMLDRAMTGRMPEAALVPPPILKRLALPQRGRLISLSVSDHYVEIVTERGKTLVLMRSGGSCGAREKWCSNSREGRWCRSAGVIKMRRGKPG